MPFQAETPTSPANCSASARTAASVVVVAGRDQHGGDGDAAGRARGRGELLRQWRRRAARCRRRPAGRRGARASGRRTSPAPSPRPWRRGRTRPPPPSAATRRRRDRLDAPRQAARDRTEWFPAAARRSRAPAPDRQPNVHLGVRRRWSDRFFPPPRCRRSGWRPRSSAISTAKRSPPVMPPPVLTITASSASAAALGKRTRSEPSSCTRVRRVRPARAATRERDAPASRDWRRRFRRCLA